MFGLGMPELIIILVIVLLIFGVGKLPQIGEGLGKAIRGFQRSLSDSSESSSSKKEPPKPTEQDKS